MEDVVPLEVHDNKRIVLKRKKVKIGLCPSSGKKKRTYTKASLGDELVTIEEEEEIRLPSTCQLICFFLYSYCCCIFCCKKIE